MNPIHFALAFIDTFNLKKLGVILFFAAIAGGGIVIYEKYTSHFHLSRVEKGADVLEKVVSLREDHTLTEEEEKQRQELLKSIEPPEEGWSVSMPEFELSFRWDKFLLGGALWAIIGMTMVFTQGLSKVKENLLATVFGSAFFGLISLISPFEGFFMMAFVTPVVVMTIFVFAILLIAKASAKKAEQDSAHQSTTRSESTPE